MMIKKEMLVIFIIVLFLGNASASLGLSPANIKIDYKPNGEYTIRFSILTDTPDMNIEVSLGGEIAKYAQLSQTKFVGGGSFDVYIKFPEETKEYGKQQISVIAKEIAKEEEFLSSAHVIGVGINTFVPYPGKFVEGGISVPDVNINELILVEAFIINRGLDTLNLNTHIDFLSESGEKVHSMDFGSMILESNKEKRYKRDLNTTGWRAGNYDAKVFFDYGSITSYNDTFRVGSLFVNATNFTKSMKNQGIQKFYIDIESRWNGKLNGVYADVDLANATKNVSFRTPGVDLGPWEKAVLVGYVDTSDLEGNYKASIWLRYADDESFYTGWVNIGEEGLSSTYYTIGITAALILLMVVILIIIMKKRMFHHEKIYKSGIKSHKRRH